MNCFSSGREVRSLWRSVPSSSVTVIIVRTWPMASGCRLHSPTYISSNGEIKMSLKLMTCGCSADVRNLLSSAPAYVLMLEMLQKLQLSVCSLGQDRRAERLHDFLYRHCLPSELILRRAAPSPLEPIVLLVEAIILTIQARRLPCRPAEGQCICRAISMFALFHRDVPAGSAPAGDLEGGSEDLGTHELRHLESVGFDQSRC